MANKQWYPTRSGTVYEDKGTGTTLRRPAFDRFQSDIFNGKVKQVVVWKLDRLSRNLRDGVNVLADCAERQLKIVVVTQQLELNGVIGRTIAALLLGLAEIEHGFIREPSLFLILDLYWNPKACAETCKY